MHIYKGGKPELQTILSAQEGPLFFMVSGEEWRQLTKHPADVRRLVAEVVEMKKTNPNAVWSQNGMRIMSGLPTLHEVQNYPRDSYIRVGFGGEAV